MITKKQVQKEFQAPIWFITSYRSNFRLILVDFMVIETCEVFPSWLPDDEVTSKHLINFEFQ